MYKQEFLDALQAKLSGLPKSDIQERIVFYREMIDDRIEEGLTEEEAVAEIGSVDEVAEQIIADIPLSQIVKEKIKPRHRMKAWEIILLVLGSPVWLSLLIAAIAVVFSLYVSLWAVIAALWSVFASLAAVGVAASGICFFQGSLPSCLAMLGTGFVGCGLAILMFFGCLFTTKATVILTKKIVHGIKKCFVKKEGV